MRWLTVSVALGLWICQKTTGLRASHCCRSTGLASLLLSGLQINLPSCWVFFFLCSGFLDDIILLSTVSEKAIISWWKILLLHYCLKDWIFFLWLYLLLSDKHKNEFIYVTSCLQHAETCRTQISPSASLKPAKISSSQCSSIQIHRLTAWKN